MVTRSGVTTIEKCTSFKMLDVSIVFLQTSKITQRDEYVLLSPFPDTFPQNFPIQRPSNTYIYIYTIHVHIYIYIQIHIYIRSSRSPVDGRSAYGIKRISRGCWKGCWEAFIMVLRRKLSGLAFPKGVFLMQEFQKLEEFR